MRDRLKTAAADGLAFAVRWSIVAAVWGALALLAVDYWVVRQQARLGSQAFGYIQKIQTTR